METTGPQESTYDWFTFYLRTTYVCMVFTLWIMDQPKQCYKLIFGKINSEENFVLNKTFLKVHGIIILSTLIFFIINLRTNFITHIVSGFEVVLFGCLILGNFTLYYYHFVRKINNNNLTTLNEADQQLNPESLDEENNKKTLKIILWILTLVTIGKIIISPSYIFYGNPKIIENNPETYLFLDNINNELLLFLLVLILFSQLFINPEFFPTTGFVFNSFEEFLGNLKNTFKIYVINIIFLTFITSKTKSNFLFIIYLLCFTTSVINSYFGYSLLKKEGVETYQRVSIGDTEL